MSNYKLTYFNIRARAEVARLIFAVAGVEFEDNRIEFEDWPKLKKEGDMPFGQLPVFEGDGMRICQSNAIGRYLANKFGFAGTTPVEKARADMLVDCVEDMTKPFMKAQFSSKDEEEKKEKVKEFMEKTLPDFLASFEKLLTEFKEGNSYFVRESITWADLAVYHWVSWFALWGHPAPLEDYPKLAALMKKVEAHPKVAAYLKTRPDAKF